MRLPATMAAVFLAVSTVAAQAGANPMLQDNMANVVHVQCTNEGPAVVPAYIKQKQIPEDMS